MNPALVYKLNAKQKASLSIDLQVLWRIDRGLCPKHGQPMSLTLPDLTQDDLQKETHQKYRLLSCPVKECSSVVKAWDWNFQGVADKPWCIEKVN